MTTITQTLLSLSLARIAGVYRCAFEREHAERYYTAQQAYAHLLDAIRTGEAP